MSCLSVGSMRAVGKKNLNMVNFFGCGRIGGSIFGVKKPEVDQHVLHFLTARIMTADLRFGVIAYNVDLCDHPA